jgi:predicted glycosyltransferase
LRLPPGEKYVLFRFVSHQVNHDRPADGLTDAMKHTLVEKLAPHARIFVSTERGLQSPFPDYELRIPPEQMHHVIAFATVVIGESATMAAEAAVLGVPAIFFDNSGRGYTTELGQKYGLVTTYGISDESVDHAINKAMDILLTKHENTFRENKIQLYRDTINITDFFVWFVENYPESFVQMKKDPGYQYQFK